MKFPYYLIVHSYSEGKHCIDCSGYFADKYNTETTQDYTQAVKYYEHFCKYDYGFLVQLIKVNSGDSCKVLKEHSFYKDSVATV